MLNIKVGFDGLIYTVYSKYSLHYYNLYIVSSSVAILHAD